MNERTGLPPLFTEIEWRGELRFEARGARGVALAVDGDGRAGPSPMETLLAALGTCGAADIADILRKGRQDLRGLTLRLTGERREEVPRRYTGITVEVTIQGGVERSRAERAVELAFEKYCSVRASLDPALPIDIRLVLEP